DSELLRCFASSGSDLALKEFLGRHGNLIYSFAMLRGGGDAALAADVTEKVAVAVSQQAEKLAEHPALVGWLFTTTRNAVIDAKRTANRERSDLQELEIHAPLSADEVDGTGLKAFLLEEI